MHAPHQPFPLPVPHATRHTRAATLAVADPADVGEGGKAEEPDIDPADVKVILLGDSAVGKSKLVERFLMDDYHPRQVRLRPRPRL